MVEHRLGDQHIAKMRSYLASVRHASTLEQHRGTGYGIGNSGKDQ